MEKLAFVNEKTINKKMAYVMAGLIQDTMKKTGDIEIALSLTLLGATITEELIKQLFNEK